MWRDIRWGGVFGAVRGRGAQLGRHGKVAAAARTGHAGGGAGRGRGPWRAVLGLDIETAEAVGRRGRAGCGLHRGERQRSGAGRDLGRARRGGPGRRTGTGARRRRAVMLPVSAPFHCSLMAPAAQAMAEALADVTDPATGRCPRGPMSGPEAVERTRHDPCPAGRAGDRPGTLARKRRLDGGPGRNRLLGDRRRQGAVGNDPAHRRAATTRAVGTPDDVAAAMAAWQEDRE